MFQMIRRRCEHPFRSQETIWNGEAWATQCGLCGHCFTIQQPEREEEHGV